MEDLQTKFYNIQKHFNILSDLITESIDIMSTPHEIEENCNNIDHLIDFHEELLETQYKIESVIEEKLINTQKPENQGNIVTKI